MIVDCAHYRDGARQHEGPLDIDRAAELAAAGGGGEFVWLGLHDPSDEELDRVGEGFGLHELALEDARDPHERPKLEEYEDSFFIVLKTARYDDRREVVDFGEINLFLGSGYAIVVRYGEASGLTAARKRLEARPELLREGPAAVGWAVLDKVVDDYFLKREVIQFHHAVFPLLGPLEALQRGAYPQVPEPLRRFLRDVTDHARRVNEEVNAQRELLTSILEANLALLSVRQNEVVKQISAWAAIIAVPTFIASVYGMNFEHMPELDSPIGYPLALAAMVVAVLALHRFFRRIGWV
jgi:magnesium transporter